MENDEIRNPKSESTPNNGVRKCSDLKETHAGDSDRINSAKIHGEP